MAGGASSIARRPPGGCWVHFSEVGIEGFRKLIPGQEVTFEWWSSSCPVEGFAFVATQVQPVENCR